MAISQAGLEDIIQRARQHQGLLLSSCLGATGAAALAGSGGIGTM